MHRTAILAFVRASSAAAEGVATHRAYCFDFYFVRRSCVGSVRHSRNEDEGICAVVFVSGRPSALGLTSGIFYSNYRDSLSR